MKHFLYILGAILVYLVIGKVVELAYFAVFPYNMADMPLDMTMDAYLAGLFRRQLWMHILVAVVFSQIVNNVSNDGDWSFYLLILGLFCSFNDVVDPFPIIVFNIICIAPMVLASWKAAQRSSAKAKEAKKTEGVMPAPEIKTVPEVKTPVREQNEIPAPTEQKPIVPPVAKSPKVAPKTSSPKGTVTIGRSAACDIVLSDSCSSASRNHATITVENGRIMYTDHSANGSIINGALIQDRMIEIIEGDKIEIPGGDTVTWDRIKALLG